MAQKPHKKFDAKANENLLVDLKKYLRENAPQVKFIAVDNLFTGEITLTEREPFKTKPGYKRIERTFKNFDEVKAHLQILVI